MKKRRSKQLSDFPNHMLKHVAVSPTESHCIPVESLIASSTLSLSALLHQGESLEEAALFLFEDLYEQGWIWYPRDRWRTAWMVTLIAVRKSKHDVSDALKVYLYRQVRKLRNPSSPYEALK